MSHETASGRGPFVVRVTIQAADCQDSGTGIVVARRPLMLLVPSHLVELVEQGLSLVILVNDIPYENARILPTPALQRNHLSILQFRKHSARHLTSAHLPKQTVQLHAGQSILLQRGTSKSESTGKITEVTDRGDGISLVTNIGVSIGDSGSPLYVAGHLAAVCQGMIQRDGAGAAVAVPLSHDSLSELRKLKRRYPISLISVLSAALLAVAIVFSGFAIYSSNTFSLAAIEVPEDGAYVRARNGQTLTLRPSWSRSFDTPIRRFQTFPSQAGGTQDRIAIGTAYRDDADGAISVLNAKGNVLWSYSVPDGECIYSTSTVIYDGYLVDVIHVADLDEDGINELLVSFVHNHHEPCKLVVFDASGEILAEYWHPGYIRTIATGKIGDDLMVVLSASNNALSTDWWHPQTLFAFRGPEIAGQSPPYDYLGAADRTDLSPGTELWVRVIVNIDPDRIRAKCYEIVIRDFDGDGENEIQAALTDGRFYYLDGNGVQSNVRLGDKFRRDFPDTEPPPLVDIWEYNRSGDDR